MKTDTMVIEENDVVMIHHNIGGLPPREVDRYSEKLVKKLADLFGKGHVAFFPVREGDIWDFTVVKKPTTKKLKKIA